MVSLGKFLCDLAVSKDFLFFCHIFQAYPEQLFILDEDHALVSGLPSVCKVAESNPERAYARVKIEYALSSDKPIEAQLRFFLGSRLRAKISIATKNQAVKNTSQWIDYGIPESFVDGASSYDWNNGGADADSDRILAHGLSSDGREWTLQGGYRLREAKLDAAGFARVINISDAKILATDENRVTSGETVDRVGEIFEIEPGVLGILPAASRDSTHFPGIGNSWLRPGICNLTQGTCVASLESAGAGDPVLVTGHSRWLVQEGDRIRVGWNAEPERSEYRAAAIPTVARDCDLKLDPWDRVWPNCFAIENYETLFDLRTASKKSISTLYPDLPGQATIVLPNQTQTDGRLLAAFTNEVYCRLEESAANCRAFEVPLSANLNTQSVLLDHQLILFTQNDKYLQLKRVDLKTYAETNQEFSTSSSYIGSRNFLTSGKSAFFLAKVAAGANISHGTLLKWIRISSKTPAESYLEPFIALGQSGGINVAKPLELADGGIRFVDSWHLPFTSTPQRVVYIRSDMLAEFPYVLRDDLNAAKLDLPMSWGNSEPEDVVSDCFAHNRFVGGKTKFEDCVRQIGAGHNINVGLLETLPITSINSEGSSWSVSKVTRHWETGELMMSPYTSGNTWQYRGGQLWPFGIPFSASEVSMGRIVVERRSVESGNEFFELRPNLSGELESQSIRKVQILQNNPCVSCQDIEVAVYLSGEPLVLALSAPQLSGSDRSAGARVPRAFIDDERSLLIIVAGGWRLEVGLQQVNSSRSSRNDVEVNAPWLANDCGSEKSICSTLGRGLGFADARLLGRPSKQNPPYFRGVIQSDIPLFELPPLVSHQSVPPGFGF